MNTCKNKQESCGNAWSKGTTRDISSYKHKRKLRLDLREGKWRDMKWVHDTPYIADDGSGDPNLWRHGQHNREPDYCKQTGIECDENTSYVLENQTN